MIYFLFLPWECGKIMGKEIRDIYYDRLKKAVLININIGFTKFFI